MNAYDEIEKILLEDRGEEVSLTCEAWAGRDNNVKGLVESVFEKCSYLSSTANRASSEVSGCYTAQTII